MGHTTEAGSTGAGATAERSGTWGSAARPRWAAVGALLGALACGACSALDNSTIPPDVTDPAITRTPAGALAAYRGTVALFQAAFGGGRDGQDAIVIGGLLSDELHSNAVGAAQVVAGPDIRILTENDPSTAGAYASLQKVRGQASQAIGLLAAYVPERPELAGELYGLAGYSEVLLAEIFCSGIPLSTLDYNGNYTYRPGSTTDDVFAHATALFDTALTLAGDSVRVAFLARLGQARALLARGQYSAAAAAVTSVPTAYTYTVSYTATQSASNLPITWNFVRTDAGYDWSYSVSDREGTTGLDYIASGDPRTAVTAGGSGATAYYRPTKYAMDGASSLVLASGIEARLIEAEAALQAGDAGTWLAKLNQLRETAITPALPDTTDPGTDTARVSLLFRERAFWLFLTGHRQGDLRRLIRQYDRSENAVYPIGAYLGGFHKYGSDVAAKVPAAERVANDRFTGCASTGA